MRSNCVLCFGVSTQEQDQQSVVCWCEAGTVVDGVNDDIDNLVLVQ